MRVLIIITHSRNNQLCRVTGGRQRSCSYTVVQLGMLAAVLWTPRTLGLPSWVWCVHGQEVSVRPPLSHRKIAPQKNRRGRFSHRQWSWNIRPSAIYSRSPCVRKLPPIIWSLEFRPHDGDFLNRSNFFTWWLNRLSREKLAPLWLRYSLVRHTV